MQEGMNTGLGQAQLGGSQALTQAVEAAKRPNLSETLLKRCTSNNHFLAEEVTQLRDQVGRLGGDISVPEDPSSQVAAVASGTLNQVNDVLTYQENLLNELQRIRSILSEL